MSGDAAYEKVLEQCVRARARALKLRQEGQSLVQRLRENMQSLVEITTQTRQRVGALRSRCGVPEGGANRQTLPPEPSIRTDTSVTNILAGMSDCDLDQLADRLIDAHEEAKLQGDEATCSVIEKALYQVGYTLAARVGPKASGLLMN